MPFGYIVNLGTDNTLGSGDSISDPWTSFTIAEDLGPGQWMFTGRDGGTNFRDEVEPGNYYLGTDGNIYFIPDFGEVDRLNSAEVISAPSIAAGNQVDGTGSGDLIDASFTDAQGDQVDDGSGGGSDPDADRVVAGGGDDTVLAGLGADTVYGGQGSDVIDGGDGDDVLYGGEAPGTATENLSWDAQGADGTDVTLGFTQTTGLMNVTVSTDATGANNGLALNIEETDRNYVEADEAFDPFSSAVLRGDGDGLTGALNISFASNDPLAQDEVTNVVFRINDVDQVSGNHQDILTITATDANGDPVEVIITPEGSDTVSGNTVTAANGDQSPAQAEGSVLVEIAGPVSDIQIVYANGDVNTQAIWISDIYFDVLPADDNDTISGGAGNDMIYGESGNDVIDGGTGSDTIDGGAGNDTIDMAEGDVVDGGAGNDVFRIVDLAETGTSAITLTGGEENGDDDVLDLNTLGDRTTLSFTTSPTGELSGSIQLVDGSLLTFSGIDRIICFTPGTMIQTASGPRAIETLARGDLIVTRDRGLQPLRWLGKRTVPATDALAPVQIDPILVPGATAPLVVSQQHRILWEGYRAQMLFGETEVLVAAKHLLSNPAVRLLEGGEVTYIHMLFDHHEVVYANGMPTESFYPGDMALCSVTDRSRHEMFELFPELRSGLGAFGDTARLCIRQHEAPLLVA